MTKPKSETFHARSFCHWHLSNLLSSVDWINCCITHWLSVPLLSFRGLGIRPRCTVKEMISVTRRWPWTWAFVLLTELYSSILYTMYVVMWHVLMRHYTLSGFNRELQGSGELRDKLQWWTTWMGGRELRDKLQWWTTWITHEYTCWAGKLS